MNGFPIHLCGERLIARGSGALWWPEQALLIVSDLHLGKAARRARTGAALLPPYETADTLLRLGQELEQTQADRVLCLGDSFDDAAAALSMSDEDQMRLKALQRGRDWLWVEGNHDSGARPIGGASHAEVSLGPLIFRHIAEAKPPEEGAEVSGHYHPKASFSLRGAGMSRPCFLIDARRIIMPAFGTYTGGLHWQAPVLRALMSPRAVAVLTGPTPFALPLAPERPRSLRA